MLNKWLCYRYHINITSSHVLPNIAQIFWWFIHSQSSGYSSLCFAIANSWHNDKYFSLIVVWSFPWRFCSERISFNFAKLCFIFVINVVLNKLNWMKSMCWLNWIETPICIYCLPSQQLAGDLERATTSEPSASCCEEANCQYDETNLVQSCFGHSIATPTLPFLPYNGLTITIAELPVDWVKESDERMLRYRDLCLVAPESRGAMNSLRKWLYRPRRDDKSLLAKFW